MAELAPGMRGMPVDTAPRKAGDASAVHRLATAPDRLPYARVMTTASPGVDAMDM